METPVPKIGESDLVLAWPIHARALCAMHRHGAFPLPSLWGGTPFVIEGKARVMTGEQGKTPWLPMGSRQDGMVDRLYRNHAGWLLGRLQRRFAGSGLEAEDLVQDTYMRVARYSEEEAERRPRALLLRIGLNLAFDQMRRNKTRPAPLAANDPDPSWDIEDCGEQEYFLGLKQAVQSLPPDLRTVFLLSRFTRMTNADIAKRLGVSVKTVEGRVSKALILCAQRLSD
ncbi:MULTISPECIES: RNA polymerase sigma factor [Sphingobium]|uniref:RNA polymerase sigma factor n=1 Tax=Sphingobium TaxID=165695 RepID=UPI0011118A95|nr:MULTISPECIES: RNA polymerase sigma factor [Sphingobium]MCB4859018.1 RNA polymerase sigma factor [Sphingobium sp. PNB]